MKILTCLLSMALLLSLSIFGGCKKSEVYKGDTALIGTTWKLVGFANARNIIELAEPSGKGAYLLNFHVDGLISGRTSTNLAGGKFVLSNKENELSIIGFTNLTEITEVFDGPRYIEAMNKVSSYRISSNGLSLYYGKGTYLLFHKIYTVEDAYRTIEHENTETFSCLSYFPSLFGM